MNYQRLFFLISAMLMFCAASCARQATMLAIGEADLEVDGSDLELGQKMGEAFYEGVRSGANNCYVDSLMKSPGQQGGIVFVLKPPPGEGYYDVTLEPQGAISAALVACVRQVFGGFYHYTDKLAFDRLRGTLRFAPKMISAPAPPREVELRPILDEKYARTGIVRIARCSLKEVSHDVSEPQLFRRQYYEVDLEFVADGYEAACHHFQGYKVFGSKPYKPPYMGHACQNKARKAGDHTTDFAEIDMRLDFYPSIARSWEVRLGGEQHLGTRPAGKPDYD